MEPLEKSVLAAFEKALDDIRDLRERDSQLAASLDEAKEKLASHEARLVSESRVEEENRRLASELEETRAKLLSLRGFVADTVAGISDGAKLLVDHIETAYGELGLHELLHVDESKPARQGTSLSQETRRRPAELDVASILGRLNDALTGPLSEKEPPEKQSNHKESKSRSAPEVFRSNGDRKFVDPDLLVDSTLDVVAHTLCSGRCSFMLLDAGTDELRIGRARGISPDVVSNARVKIGESIAGIVAASREPLLIRDLGSHPDLRAHGLGGCKTSSLLSVPVVGNGKLFGVLNVTDRETGQPFDERDLVTLSLLASHLAVCVEVTVLHEHIRQMADTDGLTGARNHRYFQQRLGEELERATRFGEIVSLAMVDVNGFKDFNDRYGHQAGDSVLREVAGALRECVRQIDLVSRYGGDEFVIILPETDGVGAIRAATRIIRSLGARQAAAASLEGFEAITLSLGISTYPTLAGSKQDLIDQADQAMYAAKRGDPPHVHCWEEKATA